MLTGHVLSIGYYRAVDNVDCNTTEYLKYQCVDSRPSLVSFESWKTECPYGQNCWLRLLFYNQ